MSCCACCVLSCYFTKCKCWILCFFLLVNILLARRLFQMLNVRNMPQLFLNHFQHAMEDFSCCKELIVTDVHRYWDVVWIKFIQFIGHRIATWQKVSLQDFKWSAGLLCKMSGDVVAYEAGLTGNKSFKWLFEYLIQYLMATDNLLVIHSK